MFIRCISIPSSILLEMVNWLITFQPLFFSNKTLKLCVGSFYFWTGRGSRVPAKRTTVGQNMWGDCPENLDIRHGGRGVRRGPRSPCERWGWVSGAEAARVLSTGAGWEGAARGPLLVCVCQETTATGQDLKEWSMQLAHELQLNQPEQQPHESGALAGVQPQYLGGNWIAN